MSDRDDAAEGEPPAEATPLASNPPPVSSLTGVRTALIIGPIVTCVGIAWTAMAPSDASSAAVLVGLITCIVGTHRFGRQGAEGASERAEAPRFDSSSDAP